MELTKIRNLSDDELKHQEKTSSEQLFRIRFQVASGTERRSEEKLRQLRKEIAQIKTVARERQLGIHGDTGEGEQAAPTAASDAAKTEGTTPAAEAKHAKAKKHVAPAKAKTAKAKKAAPAAKAKTGKTKKAAASAKKKTGKAKGASK